MARTACNVQFLSLNTRGLRNKEKRYTVFRQVKNVADIVFLQELHCLEKDKNEWCNDWQGSMVLSCGTNNSCGVGILFKESLDHNIIDQVVDDKGRYIIMRCDIQDNSFILVNVYAPNREQDHNSFLKHLLNEMNTFIKDDDDFFILGGDWNFTPTIDIDRMGGNPKLWQDSLNTLENIQLQFDLLDIWRAKHPRTRRYTWRQPRPLIQSRIDYWLISDNLQPYVDKTDICPGTRTDHSAITLQIKTFEENPPGHSYWKFNNSLIKDLEYTNSVREHFQNWITEAEDIPYYRVQWDYLKYKIAQYSRTYTKEKARIKRAEVKELECRVKDLEGNLTDDLNISQYQEAKKDLDEHHNEITKGLVIRSRAQYYEEGEKSNRYFLNLIKRNRNKTCIRKLNIENEMITDTSQIMENIKQFYSKLYSKVDRPEPVQLEYNMFLNADLPRLSDAERLKLEADVTEEELFRTLQTFKTNKSPGNDGLSAEFFTFFWDDLKGLLMKAIKESFAEGELSTSQKQGIITLLEKSGKDKCFIKNWRPISLLNIDTKLISKCLALRLIKLLPSLIHPNQLAYVKERFIGEGIRCIEDIMDYTKSLNMPGFMVGIDFEKAFDSLNHTYLREVLSNFNVGPVFISYINTLYANIESAVLNGGHSSGYFPIARGVRQGDPLSPYLFILSIEPLLAKIRLTNEIKGITVKGTTIKINAYADDITAFVSDIPSIDSLMQVLSDFNRVSGLQINTNKTEVIGIGNRHGYTETDSHLKWCKEGIKITGIYFTYDKELKYKCNFSRVLENLKSQLNIWKSRNLSLIGKIQIIKTFAISQVMFVTNMLAVPKAFVTDLNKIMFNYVWNGKDKVKRCHLVGDYHEGGLKMVDLEIKIRTQRVIWVKRLLDDSENPWKYLPTILLDKLGGKDILRGCPDICTIKKSNLTEFYKECLIAWSLYKKQITSETTVEILQHFLFNNEYIKTSNKCIFGNRLFSCGIRFLHNLYNLSEGRLYTWAELVAEGVPKAAYLEWRSVMSILPKPWKTLDSTGITEIDINMHFISKMRLISSKKVYSIFIEDITVSSTSENTLQVICENNNLDWEHYYAIPFSCTIESKARSFQYRINHNIYFTNEKLFKIQMVQSPMCSFCRNDIETLRHLFVECLETQLFWKDFIACWGGILNIESLRVDEILLGYLKDKACYKLINHLLIISKQHISYVRWKDRKPNFTEFRQRVKYIERLEYNIAVSKRKLPQHVKKWSLIYPIPLPLT